MHKCVQKACINTDKIIDIRRPLTHIFADFKMSYTGII